MIYFKELTEVIEKYNEIMKKYNEGNGISKKEENFICGISFEIAKALSVHNTETAVKAAKMILAYKESE